jgi:hypothetical protein
LAQTAAFEHQSAEQSPILLACDALSGFYQILRDLASKLLALDPTATKVTTSTKKSAGYSPLLSADAQNAVERGRIPEVHSINEGIALAAKGISVWSILVFPALFTAGMSNRPA